MAIWLAVIAWITAACGFIGFGLDWDSYAMGWTGGGMLAGLWVAGLFGLLLHG